MEIDGVQINWLGNAGFQIALPGVPQSAELGGKNSRIIYIDPYQIKEGLEKADIILLTHSHYDHCSVEDLAKIIQPGTKIVMTADCQSKILQFDIPLKYEIVQPGMELTLGEIKISTFPAYNLDKNFHPKSEEWIGYLVKMKNLLIYHAGDSDNIPELQRLTGHNQVDKKLVLCLPVGGRFTMTAEEAAEVVKIIKPYLAIPMHYGSVAGSLEDAQEFKELCEEQGNKVEILEKL